MLLMVASSTTELTYSTILASAGFLNETAPEWSAFRDDTTFGLADLQLDGAASATFTWLRNVEGTGFFTVGDSTTITNQFFLP